MHLRKKLWLKDGCVSYNLVICYLYLVNCDYTNHNI